MHKETNLEPTLPTPAGIEEINRPTPHVREHKGIHFAMTKGDPTRELTRLEKLYLDDLATSLPKLGPKIQNGPPGTLNRQVADPHKKERRVVRDALKRLQWSGIALLKEAAKK